MGRLVSSKIAFYSSILATASGGPACRQVNTNCIGLPGGRRTRISRITPIHTNYVLSLVSVSTIGICLLSFSSNVRSTSGLIALIFNSASRSYFIRFFAKKTKAPLARLAAGEHELHARPDDRSDENYTNSHELFLRGSLTDIEVPLVEFYFISEKCLKFDWTNYSASRRSIHHLSSEKNVL